MNPIPARPVNNYQPFPVERPLLVLGGLALVAGVVSSIAIAVFSLPIAPLALPFTGALAVVGAICVGIGAIILLKKDHPAPAEEKVMDQPVPVAAPPAVDEMEKLRALEYLRRGELSMAALNVSAVGEPGHDRELCLQIADQMWIRGDVWNLQKMFNEKLQYTAEEKVAFIQEHVNKDRFVKPAKDIIDLLNNHFWGELRKDLDPVLMGLFEDYIGKKMPEAALLCVPFDQSKQYFDRALEKHEWEIGKQILNKFGRGDAKCNQDKARLADLCIQEKQYSVALEVIGWIVVGEYDKDKDLKSEWLLRVFSAACQDNQNELAENAFKIFMESIAVGLVEKSIGTVLVDGSIPQFISNWLKNSLVELQKLCLNHQYVEAEKMIKQGWKNRPV